MKKTTVCGVGGILIGVIGGAYIGSWTLVKLLRYRLLGYGGQKRLDEFISLITTKEEPN